MSQYILVFIWLIFLFFVSQNYNIYKKEKILGVYELRVSKGFAMLAIIPLIWWAFIRPDSFIDTSSYINSFEALPSTLVGAGTFLSTIKKDIGFTILGIIIKGIIGNNARLYLLILASFHAVIVAYVFRKYSSNYIMSLFIFIASTDYLSWMHNTVRQFTAVILIFAATDLLIKKRYIPMIGIILIASTIHGSAILMLPIIFVVQGKPWNRKTILAIMMIVAAIVFLENFTDILETMLSDTQYTNVVSDWESFNDDGTNPLRVFVYSIPTLLSLVGLKYIKIQNSVIINIACNMGIITTILYLLSMVTSGIFIGRLPIYCSLYSMGILLPWELDNIFTINSSKIVKLIAMACFMVFYYYQTHLSWGIV